MSKSKRKSKQSSLDFGVNARKKAFLNGEYPSHCRECHTDLVMLKGDRPKALSWWCPVCRAFGFVFPNGKELWCKTKKR